MYFASCFINIEMFLLPYIIKSALGRMCADT